MLTCLQAAGWHHLPNLKDVAAAVPLPNFILAGEVMMLERGGIWKLVSAPLPVNLLSPRHHAALQLNPWQRTTPARWSSAALQAAKLSAPRCTWAAVSPEDHMDSSYLRSPFPWVTKCQMEGRENSLMLPIEIMSTPYFGDALITPGLGQGTHETSEQCSWGGQTLGRC